MARARRASVWLTFDFLPHLPVVVQQHEGQLSSDAGLLPLRQFDERWNYTQRFAACLVDPMPSSQHSTHVRADAGFGLPTMYETCEENSLTDTFGFSTNERLKRRTEGLLNQAVQEYEQTKQKQRLFDCFDYQADTWDHPSRIIAKAECHGVGSSGDTVNNLG